jgi:plastocyanin
MRLSYNVAGLVLTGLLLLPAAGSAKALDEDVAIVESGETTSWSYSPTTLTVAVGTTVTWKNTGTQTHTVTSQDQLFDSKLLDGGKSWSYTFDTPGTYRYFCVPRPWMKGTVAVTAPAEEPTPRPTPSPSPSPTSPPSTTAPTTSTGGT